MTPPLTKKEKAAIAALEELAKTWPKTLTLFDWSGSLHIFKFNNQRTVGEADVRASLRNITSGGGDPDESDVY